MADPITIIGTAGAVANIIDILGKIISTVAELRSQWKDADLEVLNLESQLTALNTALCKIKAWTESSSEDLHHQLVMDLDRCVLCCRALITKINSETSQFQMNSENHLDVASKFQLLLKTKDFGNVQRMIQQQTGALTLLLTACNATMLSEQKMILYQSQTRNAFKKMANDTESLYVHRDIDSILTTGTTTTMNSTKSSMQFEFDTELFVSKIYQRWIRGSVKKTLHEQQSETSYSTRPTTKLRAIERALGVGTSRSHPECKVLLLGADSRPDLMKLLQLVLGNGDMHEQLKSYKEAIYKDVVTSAKALVTAMRKLEVAPDSDDIWEHADFVASFDPIWEHLTASGLDPGFKSALGVILGSQYFSDIMARSADFSFPTGAEYYFAELDRIVKPGYSPSGLDILQLRPTANAVTELRTQVGQLSIHIQDAGHQAFGRRRWMKSFKNVTTIIFVVNLDEYDQLSPEDGSTNQMLEYFLLFDDVVNASYFAKTSVIMLFNQPANLKQKLEHSALEDHFPDFIGGPDVLRAAKYILWRFNLLNLAHLAIYPFLVDIYRNEAAHFMGQVLPALQETVLNNAMFGAKGT